MIEIRPAQFPSETAEIVALLRDYAADIGEDLCMQGFEQELAGLPGNYFPPAGRFLVARAGPSFAGCIALRPWEGDCCEMKRLFVRPQLRGQNIGRRLTESALREAAQAGYKAVVLDTMPSMTKAIALYKSLGFKEINYYYEPPRARAICFAVQLADTLKASSESNW